MSNFEPRMDYEPFKKATPGFYEGMTTLAKAVADSGLEKELTELIKVRASQINGCAFCLQFHLNVARKLGVSAEKLDLVATWREAGVYTPRETAALAWTEALTHIAATGAPDDVYTRLREQFSESEMAFLTVAIGTINMWNRVAGAMRFTPPVPKNG